MRTLDVAIIGAGITGCAIARLLSRYQLDVALIDAMEDVSMGASRANSAIVHAGYDCKPDTHMARMNVRGNALFDEWCADLDVPLKRTGSMVIAFDESDEKKLHELMARGTENHVPGLRIIDGDEARSLEPALNPAIRCALHAPTGGITCPYQLTIACAENARENGVEWLLGSKVTRIERRGEALYIEAGGEPLMAKYAINAAGLYADDIARLVGDESFDIKPRRGEYMLLDRGAAAIHTVIFQTPSHLGKGILVSPTVDGNTFAGPTAVDQSDKQDSSTTSEGIDELTRMSRRSVPNLNLRSVITAFSGVRSVTERDDFIIEPSKAEPRLIHAAGICSPGLTSAPAIAEEIVRILEAQGLPMHPKTNYNPTRPGIPSFRHMDEQARREAIQSNPLYGRVICRCETVTEAEIVEAIRRGARDMDGIKRRVRAGMGRCQGGFCGPRVMEILSRERNIPLHEVTKFGGGSWMVMPNEEMEVDTLG